MLPKRQLQSRNGIGTFRRRLRLLVVGAEAPSPGYLSRRITLYIKETGDPFQRVIILAVIGLVYVKLSEWKPAIEYIEQALALPQTEKKPELLAPVLGSLGAANIRLGKKQKGLEYLERSLSLIQETHDRIR